MLNRLLLLIIFSSTFLLSGQPESRSMIEVGVNLHHQGKYNEAIAIYDEVLTSDDKNLHALAEKAYSQLGLLAYKDAISTCKKALKTKSTDNESLKLVYTTYGNALDLSGKPEKALKIYNKGLTEYPGFYSLYYNKGITLSGMGDIDSAIQAFQNSAKAMPSHASSFLAMGRMLSSNRQIIPAIMSYLRFHVIEPDSERAADNFNFIQDLMFSNVTSKDGNTLSLDLSMRGLEEMADESIEGTDFRNVELILSMQSALDLADNQVNITDVEKFEKKLNTMFNLMNELREENAGFYWEFLVPYFIELTKNEYGEVLSYLVFSNQNDKQIAEWLEKNNKEIQRFYKWSASFKWN